ncbi:hypothetical protein P4361_22820 [Fictibacillus sp. B-59209]|uniref:hypothetical protein n=1 Tax=Fictibacillus sp. B-59209 TaxID=3024873 RepID=UPI002E1A65ED|nr:hypothetical protein [Fictibacillus sp. B-59209]
MKTWITVLAVLGAIFGLISGFLVTMGGELFSEADMSNDGAGVFWASFFAFVFAFTSWKWRKISGIALVIIACYGFYANGLFFTLAFLFLIVAGLMAVFSKKKVQKTVEA